MIDPNREKRVHVKNVRLKNNKYVVVLSDDSEVDWDIWITMTQYERWNQ
jgi:hypothetical protein